MSGSQTSIVELTPPGRGAVAVVLVAGLEATALVDRCFTPRGPGGLADAPPDRVLLGRWGGPAGEELIVCRRAVDRVEIHCHGGLATVRAVIDRLASLGGRPVAWQDWLDQSIPDPITAAAHRALAAAPTMRTAAVLLDQAGGALAAGLRTARDAAADGNWCAAAAGLDEILALSELGQRLTRPWRVVLAGPPNVGKSSLINALAGYQRAIVSHLPGTTRDIVTATTAVDGWPIQLADTAGLRVPGESIEREGIALAAATMAAADLVVLVADAGEAMVCTADEGDSLARLPSEMPTPARSIRVLNKIDLLAADDGGAEKLAVPWRASFDVETSAVTGAGIAGLLSAVRRALVPVDPPPGAAVAFTSEQAAAISAARAAVAARNQPAFDAALAPLFADR